MIGLKLKPLINPDDLGPGFLIVERYGQLISIEYEKLMDVLDHPKYNKYTMADVIKAFAHEEAIIHENIGDC